MGGRTFTIDVAYSHFELLIDLVREARSSAVKAAAVEIPADADNRTWRESYRDQQRTRADRLDELHHALTGESIADAVREAPG